MGTRTVAFMLVGRDDTWENFRTTGLPESQRPDMRDVLAEHLPDDKQLGAEDETPSVWGIHDGQRSVWDGLDRGDVVFFLRHGESLGWAEVQDKVVSEGLAETLWGRDPVNDRVFGNVLLLTPFRSHRVPMTEVRAILGWKPNANLRQNGIGRTGREQQLLREGLPRDAARRLLASAALPEGTLTAKEYLQLLTGRDLTTSTGATNTVLTVSDDTVLVGTSRSPEGQPVPVQDVQSALEDLVWKGQVRVTPSELGYRSTFVGSVLASLEGVEVGEADGVTLRLRSYATDDWSDRDVRILVAEYLTMLKAQLKDQPFIKAEHNRRVRTLVANRTRPSVEFKLRNVSFVLSEMGLPWVEGYLPASNRQLALVGATTDALDADSELLDLLAVAKDDEDGHQPRPTSGAFVPPPPAAGSRSRSEGNVVRPGVLGSSEGAGAALGLDGERWVCELERERLRGAGLDELAERVEHVSQTQGDGLGYDVLSFNNDGSPRRIEVKTTTGGPSKSFLVTPNEVRKSAELSDEYCLYRVFAFATQPRVWMMAGDLSTNFDLEPQQFTATLAAHDG